MRHSSPITRKEPLFVDTIVSDDTTVSIEHTRITAATPLTKRMLVARMARWPNRQRPIRLEGTYTNIEHTGTPDDVLVAYTNVLRSLTPYQAIIAARLPSPLITAESGG